MVTIIRGTFYFLFVIGFSLTAQTINITGKVSNRSGNPIYRAIVTLKGHDLSDTTGEDGSFEIIQKTSSGPLSSPILMNSEKKSFCNGIVSISLMHPTRVKIEMFDIRGVLLGQVLDHRIIPGKYRFDLNNHPLSKRIMLVRVSTGRSSMVFRSIHLNNGRQATNSSTTSISLKGNTFAKLKTTVDVLKVSASGYIETEVPISSYEEQNVDITLDTITLPLFNLSIITSRKESVVKIPEVELYEFGTNVTLTATPSTGYSFVGWSGDASGSSGTVDIVMDSDKSVTADWAIVPLTGNLEERLAAALDTVIYNGNALSLSIDAWRDFMPPIHASGTALRVAGYISAPESVELPDGLIADSIWIFNDNEAWSEELSSSLVLPYKRVLSFNPFSDGPYWDVNSKLTVIVRIQLPDGWQVYFRKRNVNIDMTV